jgi:predicted acyltransferase (DUF342 family)
LIDFKIYFIGGGALMKKFELTDESIEHDGHILYRIKALRSFSGVKKGSLGGFIEKESNLSHDGICWIYGNAKAFENARVWGNARVSNDSHVGGNALVYGDSWVYGNAQICGDCCIYGSAQVYGNAQVCGEARISGKSAISGKCILTFNTCTYLINITLDHGVWTDSYIIDNKKYIISNTLEQLCIGGW